MNTNERPDLNLQPSFDLPIKLKCAISDCITLYSKLDSCIVEIVWILEGANLERKKEIARAWGDQNLKFVKQVIKLIPNAKTDAIWPALKSLRNERNLIGHGVWMVTKDDQPLVVWHSKFLESNDWIGAEFFDWARFDYFRDRGQLLLKTFSDLKAMLERDVADKGVMLP